MPNQVATRGDFVRTVQQLEDVLLRGKRSITEKPVSDAAPEKVEATPQVDTTIREMELLDPDEIYGLPELDEDDYEPEKMWVKPVEPFPGGIDPDRPLRKNEDGLLLGPSIEGEEDDSLACSYNI